MLCYKLNTLPVHHCHTAMNLYEIIPPVECSHKHAEVNYNTGTLETDVVCIDYVYYNY